MNKIKKFSEELKELKRNTVVAMNQVDRILDAVIEEGENAQEATKTFSDENIAEKLENLVNNAVNEAVNKVVEQIAANAVNQAAPVNKVENLSNALVNLLVVSEDSGVPEINAVVNSVANVVNQVAKNQIAAETVANALQTIVVAKNVTEENSPANVALNQVANLVNEVVASEPRSFSDSVNTIINQQEQIAIVANQARVEGQEPIGTDEDEVKAFSELSPALKRLLNQK